MEGKLPKGTLELLRNRHLLSCLWERGNKWLWDMTLQLFILGFPEPFRHSTPLASSSTSQEARKATGTVRSYRRAAGDNREEEYPVGSKEIQRGRPLHRLPY